MSTKLALDLRDLLGDDVVADDTETLASHSGDKWFATHPPEAVVFAESTADVSKLLQFASREKIAVTARGGGFGYVGGCVPARAPAALLMHDLQRVLCRSVIPAHDHDSADDLQRRNFASRFCTEVAEDRPSLCVLMHGGLREPDRTPVPGRGQDRPRRS